MDIDLTAGEERRLDPLAAAGPAEELEPGTLPASFASVIEAGAPLMTDQAKPCAVAGRDDAADDSVNHGTRDLVHGEVRANSAAASMTVCAEPTPGSFIPSACSIRIAASAVTCGDPETEAHDRQHHRLCWG